jgi:AcrR family transcriptional regulator
MARRIDDTRSKLIDAASELFAKRGFHATTARDIARRAGVNLAAGNYHYGSKKELYVEVLREQFATIGKTLARRGGSKPPAEVARLTRKEALALLERRIAVILDMLIGPPPAVHGALMQREMADPSQAFPIIVEEFIRPMSEEMQQIVARLAPELSPAELRRTVLSIIAQAVFYRFAMPAVLALHGLADYPRGFAANVAEHVARFSIGGIERVAARRKRGARAR